MIETKMRTKRVGYVIAAIWAIAWIIMGLYFINSMIQLNSVSAAQSFNMLQPNLQEQAAEQALNIVTAFGLMLIGLSVSGVMAAAGTKDITEIKVSHNKQTVLTYTMSMILVLVVIIIIKGVIL